MSKKFQFGTPDQIYNAVTSNKNEADCKVNNYAVTLAKYEFNRYESSINSLRKRINEVNVESKTGVMTVKTTRTFAETLKVTVIVGT